MRKSAIALTLTVLSLLCSMQAQAIPVSYGTATHATTAWQELATYDGDTETSSYGVFWSVDNGATWGHETNLLVGQNVQFSFNMHKDNVGTHYADFLKAWVDWGQDGEFGETDAIAFGNEKLRDNERRNRRSWNSPKNPDFTFYSDTYLLEDDDIGDLWLRARVTCSESLVGREQWRTDTPTYDSAFNPTGWLWQGEVEEWKISVNAAPAPVPEPATIVLLGCGLLGLAGFNRRKKQ